MSEINHPVFGRYDPELICECNHPRKYHNHMGLSENLIIGTNCNACSNCREFKAKDEQPDTYWQKELKRQIQRVPMDMELREVVLEGIERMSSKDAKEYAEELRMALDVLPKILKDLENTQKSAD